MAIYSSSDQLQEIMVELWKAIRDDQSMAGKIIPSRLTVRFTYREPDGIISIDCSDGKTMKIESGPSPVKPIVEMAMKAEVAHEFWLGNVSIPIAIMTGKIVSKGPVNKALSLLPVIKPAFEIYPAIYETRVASKVTPV
ncbi:MAG TPA: hypothetical protein V6C72_12110 [Chroococcales cyanobacterium]